MDPDPPLVLLVALFSLTWAPRSVVNRKSPRNRVGLRWNAIDFVDAYRTRCAQSPLRWKPRNGRVRERLDWAKNERRGRQTVEVLSCRRECLDLDAPSAERVWMRLCGVRSAEGSEAWIRPSAAFSPKKRMFDDADGDEVSRSSCEGRCVSHYYSGRGQILLYQRRRH